MPQSRLEFFIDQRPQSVLCHTLRYNEIPQSRHWICDPCLEKHKNKAYDCRIEFRHAAVTNSEFLPSFCAICYTLLDVYAIYSACNNCAAFYKEHFINLSIEEFIEIYHGNTAIVKRWTDCKFYKIVNPCDKPLII